MTHHTLPCHLTMTHPTLPYHYKFTPPHFTMNCPIFPHQDSPPTSPHPTFTHSTPSQSANPHHQDPPQNNPPCHDPPHSTMTNLPNPTITHPTQPLVYFGHNISGFHEMGQSLGRQLFILFK